MPADNITVTPSIFRIPPTGKSADPPAFGAVLERAGAGIPNAGFEPHAGNAVNDVPDSTGSAFQQDHGGSGSESTQTV